MIHYQSIKDFIFSYQVYLFQISANIFFCGLADWILIYIFFYDNSGWLYSAIGTALIFSSVAWITTLFLCRTPNRFRYHLLISDNIFEKFELSLKRNKVNYFWVIQDGTCSWNQSAFSFVYMSDYVLAKMLMPSTKE